MIELARLMLDHCPELMLLVNPENLQIELANASAYSALGYESGKLQGLPITDVETDLKDLFYWQDAQAGQYQQVADQEAQYRRSGGDLMSVRKSVVVITPDDKPMLMISAVPSQQERVAEEALAHTLSQLRATLESTGNGIVVLDWHGKVSSMNRMFGQMWDIPSELLNWQDDGRILDFVVSQVNESELLRQQLNAVMRNDEARALLHHVDGRIFEVSSRPQFLYEQTIGRVFSFQDITERMQAEQALRDSRDFLEERVLERTADLNAANEKLECEKELQSLLIQKLEAAQNQLLQSERMASIGQLAAGVAHEINNPVGFVNSNLGTLQNYVKDIFKLIAAYEQAQSTLPGPQQQQLLHLAQDIDINFLRTDMADLLKESIDGLQRVKRIVQDLKDFSHVDEAEFQYADIEAGLESTLRVVWNELKYKCEVVKAYAGIPHIECFPFQLNQVFMNLLVNAANAIEGHGTITIRTGQEGDQVWVEIQDTGKGIPPENLNRIYEPFFTTKPVGKGTGLGLSLAYGIIQKHRGSISVQSQVGVGSTFRICLPLKQTDHVAVVDNV
ncbi:MAG: PAS domain S-box protein [Rhodoferax sp.]|nr:PAS domain S-box protein [Rhodoferax sp.]OIP24337.1 MAG: histidine kinase [Comamonadaceae bacterium CG2_30_60_41]PIW08929.1 MAG: histidine kinase [Comamonadaceae bacterium CG17_big_fil_post_rev_8_21_14_2_50_60_13]PIY23694.1 MAG: histidine kinase [Comamonadaceae bacterium CG_4_10_14_3_um_filter_60_75]PJC15385.1 MAG: histidine kinase [Comamonadaceae bacterium CG_4_9_14_0_8_um_filter_60_18]